MTHKPNLFGQIRNSIRLNRSSIRTEQAHIVWFKRFILFHQEHHPAAIREEATCTCTAPY
jgi:hypothetical protein